MNKSLCKDPSELTILVTGGAGFIGSHTTVELLENRYKVVVVDDLSNSNKKAIDRVASICDLTYEGNRSLRVDGYDLEISEYASSEAFPALSFVQASILDKDILNAIFDEYDIDAVIHFAGFKAVGESVEKPWEYYWNNLVGSLVLIDVAREHNVKNLVFSSSATVYGEPDSVPLTESSPKHDATNPYGWTKSMLEQIFSDMHVGDDEWNIALLRYFNPIGAHPSGEIGEDPLGIPNNLVPYVSQVAIGKLPEVRVFGDDYPTPDGTGIRDYIHVVDLARGHVAALDWLGGKVGSSIDGDKGHRRDSDDCNHSGVGVFNLGTGRGSSVLDVIHAFEKASGKEIPYSIHPRRSGDIAESYAACDKAREELGWVAEYDLDKMCEDSWRWQSKNPNGYRD